jgi:hypothetical protein
MKFTEAMLDTYATPLSDSEDKRCQHAIGMIRDALKNIGYSEGARGIERMLSETYAYRLEMSSASTGRSVTLLVQGSYANNTNVKASSDVDIAVILESTFRPEYRQGITGANYHFSASSDNVSTFKDDVEKLLKNYFVTGVHRKNKSIKVDGNTYRVDADTVPCMRFRNYAADYVNDPENYVGGIVINADDGEIVINYPEQHIRNGRAKNAATNHLYKKMVRIIKKMRYMMEENGVKAADATSSFGLESLLWNVPDSWYLEYSAYRKVFTFSSIIDYLLAHKDSFGTYKEANGIKPLCPDASAIAKMQLFMDSLRAFYSYE